MPHVAFSESHTAFDLPTSPSAYLDQARTRADHDSAGHHASIAPPSERLATDGPAVLTPPSHTSDSRTITHVYEPVRDEQERVVDFRLTFDAAGAHEATRPFIGIQVVRTGDWAAPGAIFHTLKRVLDSGQSLHEMTRHVGANGEVCFYQTANRVGDTAVTTTSIVVMVPR